MTEKQEIRARAIELALMYTGPRPGALAKDIGEKIKSEITPLAAIFERLISEKNPTLGDEHPRPHGPHSP